MRRSGRFPGAPVIKENGEECHLKDRSISQVVKTLYLCKVTGRCTEGLLGMRLLIIAIRDLSDKFTDS
jgi:hypothetical protein